MSGVIEYLVGLLGHVMRFCYEFTGNYGFSIILFTFLTKLVLFPLSILTQKNSIRMVKLQPELDQLKIKFIDDKDKYADAQLDLYKKYKYNPFLDTLPLILQIPIVLGLVGVVYRPLSFILNIDRSSVSALEDWLVNAVGITDAGNLYQMKIIEQLRNGAVPPDGVPEEVIARIGGFSMMFAGIDLGRTPGFHGDYELLLIPFFAGLSAFILCLAQNRFNVLQIAQGKLNKVLTTVFMVAFSAYFAMIVPCAVGLYWIAGNLFAIPLMLVVNRIIPPKKYVDYERLQEMKAQKQLKEEEYRKYSKREKEDYKRFFAVKDMKLMFYSEQNGFYKYFSGMIDYICTHSNITIHYVTSDPEDNIFKDERKQIQAYYVASDRYLVPLFMKLDADMCVMTMPDLEKYHIKRSRVRDDVEYVFAAHGIGSITTYRKSALDWFDTILCPTTDQAVEIRAYERLYGSPEKLIVETGYPLIDDMLAEYQSRSHEPNDIPQVIIAPSWQKDNIIELCAENLLDALCESGYRIILRPHPQHVRHEPERFAVMKEKYRDNKNIEIETDFSGVNSVMSSDILVTDWSDISCEFAFVTKRPVIFIDTPMKVMNHDYEKIGIEPFNKTIREEVGKVISVENIDKISEVVSAMLAEKEQYRVRIDKAFNEHLYNIGRSSEIIGRYIIKSLKSREKQID